MPRPTPDLCTGSDMADFKEHRVPTVTQWQRFWGSPWTWLVLGAFYGAALAQSKGDWLTWGVFIVCCIRFWETANKRWGKP